MQSPGNKRIAILGFDLEANRFAPVCGRAEFEERAYYEGEAISRDARATHPAIHGGICGFYATMDAAGDWTPAPILYTGSTPNGPVDQGFFDEVMAKMQAGLTAAAPLDGVYICEHGAAVSTGSHDPDGDLFSMVRETVGADVPVIATLDLHTNVSRRMVDATDLLIAYRTNPHVDQFERGAEAAAAMREMFDGVRPATAFVRLPLVAPSVTLLTAEGQPYGDLIRLGQSKIDADVLNVSITAGFAFSDTPKNGMGILVTTRGDAAKALALADELATAGWADRARYRTNMIDLDMAVRFTVETGADPARPSLLFADVADNPGGGGRGNTTYILKALHAAGAQGVLLGVVTDPPLVEAAFAAGEGGAIDARFNSEETQSFSEPFSAPATVVRLSDGEFVGRKGMVADRTVRVGRSCLLDLGGIQVVVISARQQCLSTDFFEYLGADVAVARSVVVKSRGHFRAGFQHLFPPERIHEVDVPGLTSPNLANFDWQYLPRPVYPLDPDTVWPSE